MDTVPGQGGAYSSGITEAYTETTVRIQADATHGPVKLTVNVSREAYNALKAMAEQRGVTLTEMLRQAISTAKWVQETTAQGEKILKQDRAGHLFEVVFR
jgi:Ribbon-helix-helix protein, copG family